MKEIAISIAKSDLFAEIALLSAYAGMKNAGGNALFERVATAKHDEALLERFWHEFPGILADTFQGIISSCQCSDTTFSMTIAASGAYDDALTPSVKTDIFNAFVAGVAARWFDVTFPEKAAEWHLKADTLLKSVLSKLSQRKKPSRTQPS